ncbi:hypothetical protein Fcan01_22690 [Folsomia candida]|uniref:Uncharacterized protein n=1 Tax=Folsomia candida TaxID=158441 RepID=A0A226DCH0_FOLCA|nr:hypothetical protein Fcan01_22690 [Folsomia candida]
METSMSVVTVMLHASTQRGWLARYVTSYNIKIGGLNPTELYDLKQFSPPSANSSQGKRLRELNLAPQAQFSSEKELNLACEVIRSVVVKGQQDNPRMEAPPLDAVAPFLSRIKSWGYRITFYKSYAGEVQHAENGFLPILAHTWILEK